MLLDAPSGWDKTLVRHIYDVHQIIQSTPKLNANTEGLARMVLSVIANDAIDFKNQHPQFYIKPLIQLNDALTWASNSKDLKSQYETFVADMVYALPNSTPSFYEALDVFSKVLRSALVLIKPENINAEMQCRI